MYVCMLEESIRSQGAIVIDGCELPHMCWGAGKWIRDLWKSKQRFQPLSHFSCLLQLFFHSYLHIFVLCFCALLVHLHVKIPFRFPFSSVYLICFVCHLIHVTLKTRNHSSYVLMSCEHPLCCLWVRLSLLPLSILHSHHCTTPALCSVCSLVNKLFHSLWKTTKGDILIY